MGTKVGYKSYLPAYYSMRDHNEDSNSCSWPLYNGNKTLTNGQYHNGFSSRATADTYLGDEKDALKRTMLEHQAIFKNQVYELHRLYRIQRELMDEIKRKELHRKQMTVGSSFPSSPLASQVSNSEDARKLYLPGFPVSNSPGARLPFSGVENILSPSSTLRENNGLVGKSHFLFQNGDSLKDFEARESRPRKVRRKILDLTLPAEEYVDSEEEEQFHDKIPSSMLSSIPNRNKKIEPESGVKLYHEEGERAGFCGAASRSSSCFKNANLADLNEAFYFEETNSSAYEGDTRGHDLSAKPNLPLLGLPREISPNSVSGNDNETWNNIHLENNVNGRGILSRVLEAGCHKNKQKSISHGFQVEKLPMPLQSIHVFPEKINKPAGKVEYLKEAQDCDLQLNKRNHEIYDNKHLGPFAASHLSNPYPVAPPDLSHSTPSEKPSWNFFQKSITVPTQPCSNSAATVHMRSHSSAQSNGIIDGRWHLSSDSKSTGGLGSAFPHRSVFYIGSSPGPKEREVQPSSISYDFSKRCDDNKGLNNLNNKSANDIDLNMLLSNSSSNRSASRLGPLIREEQKNEENCAKLPWLRVMPDRKSEATDSGRFLNNRELGFRRCSMDQFPDKIETGNVKSSSPCSSEVVAKRSELGECPSSRKLLGFPNFEEKHISNKESFCLTSQSGEVEEIRRNRVLDINLPCEPSIPESVKRVAPDILVTEKDRDTKFSSFRDQIDLNSFVSIDEPSPRPLAPVISANIFAEIDLEVPAVPETEEDIIPEEESIKMMDQLPSQSSQHKSLQTQDVLVTVAAEAIVSISSSGFGHTHLDNATCSTSEDSPSHPLNWFVEVIFSCERDENVGFNCDTALRGKCGTDNMEEGMNHFESMTLRLQETSEEEYTPKPSVPENIEIEETGPNLLQKRPRKGQTRRGRQRRDFHRDILPGLTSLSRNEITEDLQTFGGLMRATGHIWNSGLARRNSRNGRGRGRRRSVISPSLPVSSIPDCTQLMQQLCNVETEREDRCLTGWGKTTRRPRRQRGPSGKPPPAPLTNQKEDY